MRILADTHVHLYAAYDFGACFRRAFAALRARAGGTEGDWRGALCLAERAGETLFAALRAGRAAIPGFRVAATDDPAAVTVVAPDHARLAVIAGRQIVSRERIEVLALGADAAVADGAPLDATLAAVRAAGALPVIAGAPGQWR